MHKNCINELDVQTQLFHLFSNIPKGDFIDGKYCHVFNDEYKWETTISKVFDILDLNINTSIVNVDPVTYRSSNKNNPTIGLNDKYKNRLVSNVYKIEYNNLYSTILIRMDRGDETASDISKLMSSVIKFRESIKSLMYKEIMDIQLRDAYNTAQINAKVFVNYIYGKCNKSKYLMASFSIHDYIKSEVSSMWKRINEYLGDDIIYFDNDMAYVITINHTEAEIFKAFDSELLTYEYDIMQCVGFHRNKMVYKFPEKIPYFTINETTITPFNY